MIDKYPLYAKYERLTGGALSAYICTLSLNGYTDDEIPIKLYVRWAYLFSGMTWEDWRQVVAEFRDYQKESA